MDHIKLRIIGIASRKLVEQYKKAFNVTSFNDNELLLFCDYSSFEIKIGHVFNTIKDLKRAIIRDSNIKLQYATQQSFIPLRDIPQGYKTICLFEFPLSIPEIVKDLPTISDWYEAKVSLEFID